VPSTYLVERSLVINAPPEEVFGRVSNLRKWSEWSPWEELDPNMQKAYTGEDGAVGSTYTWQGNRKAGRGRMMVSGLDEPTGATIDLQFLKPFKSQSTTAFQLVEDGGSTRVTWTMTGAHTWMTKIMGLFVTMDKMIGKDFEKGLAKLKTISET